uniref:Uncharacterized protein n=1 Tax=Populus trichocarpa TaxID=3694 RepID=A0A2K1Y5J6_POPTR
MIIALIFRNLFHIFRAPDTRIISDEVKNHLYQDKMTDPFSVLSIGSIITSRTLISRNTERKKSTIELPNRIA